MKPCETLADLKANCFCVAEGQKVGQPTWLLGVCGSTATMLQRIYKGGPHPRDVCYLLISMVILRRVNTS